MKLRPTEWVLLVTLLSMKVTDAQFGFLLKLSIPQYYAGTELLYNILGRFANHKEAARLGKLQQVYTDMPFPCDVTNARSPERPTSVHALRPGDIDVIGSMGDSLTAGTGALASNIAQVIITNRGVTFSGGGQSDWRKYLTLPNILKVFNPNLIGYSLGDAVTWDRKAQFNVAEPGAMSADVFHQARIILKRMKSDKRVNFTEDWKLVTMMIGPNDFCLGLCYNDLDYFLAKHRLDMIEALDYLYENAPRLLINIIPPPNLKILMEMTDRPLNCQIYTSGECPCLIGLSYEDKRQSYIEVMDKWQKMDIDIGNNDKYRGRDDFAIVIQPFSTEVTFPQVKMPHLGRNSTDYTYLSADCFHFSQKTDAMTANALWNNMVEPVGHKATNWMWPLFDKFLCPTEEHPFIYTFKNSPASPLVA